MQSLDVLDFSVIHLSAYERGALDDDSCGYDDDE